MQQTCLNYHCILNECIACLTTGFSVRLHYTVVCTRSIHIPNCNLFLTTYPISTLSNTLEILQCNLYLSLKIWQNTPQRILYFKDSLGTRGKTPNRILRFHWLLLMFCLHFFFKVGQGHTVSRTTFHGRFKIYSHLVTQSENMTF